MTDKKIKPVNPPVKPKDNTQKKLESICQESNAVLQRLCLLEARA